MIPTLALLLAAAPPAIVTLPHPDPTAAVVLVRYSPDGHRLLAAGYPSGVVQVFDTATLKERHRFAGPKGYRGSSEYCLVADDFSRAYVLDCDRNVVEVNANGKREKRVVYSGGVRGWDLKSGKPLEPFGPLAGGRGTEAGYLSAAGDRLLSVERATSVPPLTPPNGVVLWDTATGTGKSMATGYAMAAFAPDGKSVAVCLFAEDATPSRLFVRDLASGKDRTVATSDVAGRGFSWPVFAPDGKTLVVEDGPGRVDKPSKLRLFDAASGKETATVHSGGDYPFLPSSFSPDGRYVAAGDYAGGVRVFDARTGAVVAVRRFESTGVGRRIAFSPDSRTAFALVQTRPKDLADSPDPTALPRPRLLALDLKAGTAAETELPPGYCGMIAVRPDGKEVAVGGAGGVHLVPR